MPDKYDRGTRGLIGQAPQFENLKHTPRADVLGTEREKNMENTIDRSAAATPRTDSGFAGLRVHLIGIGGSGMSAAASMLLELGADVSGSDLQPFDGLGQLVANGARVSIGHQAMHLDRRTDLVVISAAIPSDNPELTLANHNGNSIVKYAQLLGRMMSDRIGIGIAGTHGKTTTTAMCSFIFHRAQLDPAYVFGARSDQLGGGSSAGRGPHFIAESCEYDRSFLHLFPKAAAILNVEPDHLDYFHSFEALVEAFGQFAANVEPSGLLVCNAEDKWSQEAARQGTAAVETFGVKADANWQSVNMREDFGRYLFDLHHNGEPVTSIKLQVPGLHNVANALAAAALADHAGIDADIIGSALSEFAGVNRRLTWRGKGRGVTIVDDYAHHPTEIRATLDAVRNRYRPRRTWVVFQPHQHARTRFLLDEFADSLHDVDEVLVPDVYDAREQDAGDQQVGSAELVSLICTRGGHAQYLPTLQAAADHVVSNAAEGDLVVTMGAGDVWKVADELVERIC